MTSPYPWTGLPAALADDLRVGLPETVDATILAISREVPAYRGALEREIGPTVRRGVEIALSRMLELFATEQAALVGRAAQFYERIGAGEYALGRSLEALLAAYRTGARVAWERMSQAALSAGATPAVIVVLAESIFVYIDELSGASAQGHARAAVSRTGYQEVLRSQLAQALIDGLALTEPSRLHALAEKADWRLPDLLAVAVVPKATESSGPPLPMAPPDVLVLEREDDAVAVIPDPTGPGRARRLRRQITGAVYVGSIRPPQQAPVSFTHAAALRELGRIGVVPHDRVVVAADHLPELLLGADPVVAEQIRERALGPLQDLPAGRRRVLQETLAAWLDCHGDRARVAQTLIVHPQTVSYRVNQLRARYGADLDDPRMRLMMQLALLGQPH